MIGKYLNGDFHLAKVTNQGSRSDNFCQLNSSWGQPDLRGNPEKGFLPVDGEQWSG